MRQSHPLLITVLLMLVVGSSRAEPAHDAPMGPFDSDAVPATPARALAFDAEFARLDG